MYRTNSPHIEEITKPTFKEKIKEIDFEKIIFYNNFTFITTVFLVILVFVLFASIEYRYTSGKTFEKFSKYLDSNNIEYKEKFCNIYHCGIIKKDNSVVNYDCSVSFNTTNKNICIMTSVLKN